jgi:hypothetical protein
MKEEDRDGGDGPQAVEAGEVAGLADCRLDQAIERRPVRLRCGDSRSEFCLVLQ